MDKLKQWIVLTVLGALVIVAAAWFGLVSPKRGEAADTRDAVAAKQAATQDLEMQLQVLQTKADELPGKRRALDEVTAKIPTGPALPALVRALTKAAASADVELVSVTPGTPAPPVPAAAVAAAPVPAAPAPAGATPAPSAAPVIPAAPVAPAAAGVAGSLAVIPIGINVVGSYFDVQQFVASLEDLPRALRISSLGITPGLSPTAQGAETAVTAGRSLQATITGSVFMATGAAPLTPAAAPAAPAAVPAK